MSLFIPTKQYEKEWRTYYRQTQGMGAVPIGFALMQILSMPTRTGPGVWCALGVAIGLQLILWGIYNLHLARRNPQIHIANPSKRIPALLFIIHHLFGMLILVMLWISMGQLGFPSTLPLNIIFYSILPLIPAKAFMYDVAHSSPNMRHAIINEVLFFTLIILLTLLASLAGTDLILRVKENMVEKLPFNLVLIWVLASISILTCLILLAEHIHEYVKGQIEPGVLKEIQESEKQPY